MIQLFNVPRGIIDLSHYDNLLYGCLVKRFEATVADYVSARHTCSFNSASSAIFLILRMVAENWPHLEMIKAVRQHDIDDPAWPRAN